MNQSKDVLESLKTKSEDETVWVENMLDGRSVFRGRDDNKYEMEPHGYVGSIISMPARVIKTAGYLLRKAAEGKIRILSDSEAEKRSGELVFRETDASVSYDRIQEALAKGASDSGSRYTKKDLPDSGEERGSISAKQIWDDASATPAAPKAKKSVRRSNSTIPVEDSTPDGPIEAVITEPVREGEWQPDTGV